MSDGRIVARTVWISDVHLGTPECQTDRLISFLRKIECEHLYLVGDIFDFMALRRRWFWPQAHNDIVQMLLRKAGAGTRITFIPGNHDEELRQYAGYGFGGVEILREARHTTPDGKTFLVRHGDEYDGLLYYAHMAYWLFSWIYVLLFIVNRLCNSIRRWLGWQRASISGWLMRRANAVFGNGARLRELTLSDARSQGVDGVICGHTHLPEIRTDEGFLFMNCGDWVEHCTALVEHYDGQIELVQG